MRELGSQIRRTRQTAVNKNLILPDSAHPPDLNTHPRPITWHISFLCTMFMSLASHVLWYVSALSHPPSHPSCSAWFAFALPSYSTYKALAHSASADTLQALSTYWAVIGAFIAFEQSLGLFLSWSVLPFSSTPSLKHTPGCPSTGS